MNIYEAWGFRQTPFDTNALPCSEVGDQLLVGRDAEMARLINRLHTPPNIPTVEGPNGIGKTSVIHVAAYKCFQSYLKTGKGALLLPCEHVFRLSPDETPDEFEFKVLCGIAYTLCRTLRDILEKTGRKLPGVDVVDQWLNSAFINTFQGGIGPIQFGQSKDGGTTGYEVIGFKQQIRAWLAELFPEPRNGGVVCVIDNLEGLKSCATATAKLEELRDTVLSTPGLRWVLSGAQGVIRGIVSTRRLAGRLYSPIEIHPLHDDSVPSVLSSREAAFHDTDFHPKQTYLPIVERDFEKLYFILHGSIRDTLDAANEYCFWTSELPSDPPASFDEKRNCFNQWLQDEATETSQSAEQFLDAKTLLVFEQASSDPRGAIRAAKWRDLGCESEDELRAHVEALEQASLVQFDISHAGERVARVTPKGWLVRYVRLDSQVVDDRFAKERESETDG